MNKRGKIALYFFHENTSFTDIDKDIFSSRFQVLNFRFHIKGQFSLPFLWIRELIFLLKNIKKASIGFSMFAGYHSLLPALIFKLYNKPFVIIAGGIDCVAFPEIKYGNFNKKILGHITRLSFQKCTHIAPISEYLVNSEYTYTPSTYPRQGFQFFCPNLKTPYSVIYNGFRLENWYSYGQKRPPRSFLSIAGNLDNQSRIYTKGIDLVLQAAAELPDCQFTIIGRNAHAQDLCDLPNVHLLPFTSHEKLIQLYNEHTYYFQLSVSEGFGNTLAEAMLCECIPIGSNAGAIPMIIDQTGFILMKKDKDLLIHLIHEILSQGHSGLAKKARQRILNNFSIENRALHLHSLIDSLLMT